jgi:ribosomal protein L9
MEYSSVLAVLAQITNTKTRLQKNAEENQKVDFRSLAVPRTISNTKTQLQKNTEENQKLFSRIQTTD